MEAIGQPKKNKKNHKHPNPIYTIMFFTNPVYNSRCTLYYIYTLISDAR